MNRPAARPYRERTTQRRIQAAGVERTPLESFRSPREASDRQVPANRVQPAASAPNAPPATAARDDRRSANANINVSSVSANSVNINNTTNITNINTSTYTKSHGTKVANPWWGHGYKKPKSKLSFAIAFYSGGPSLAFHFGKKHYYHSGWKWWSGYYSHFFAWSYYPTYYCTTNWWNPTPWRPAVVHHHFSSPRPVVQHVHHHHPSPPPVVHVEPDPCPYSLTEAWYVLADDSPGTALAAFGCLAREYPFDGLTLVGRAIAEALAGSDQSAVLAMRHAVRTDPRALLLVPQDESLDDRLFLLLEHYTELASTPNWRIDGAFMLAALRAAVGDLTGAHFAVNEAIDRGDTHPSAKKLRDLLTQRLQQSMFNAP